MTKIPILVTACIATLAPIGILTAEAKQQCKASMPSDPHGSWWSYRLIDGRKCWYEGKPGFSKALLEWPKEAAAEPPAEKVARAVKEEKVTRPAKELVASTIKEKAASPLKEKISSAKQAEPRSPLDSQAWAPIDLDSFEARWRARVEDR